MKIIKTELKETDVVADIFCNKCGESCRGSIGNFNGLIEVKIEGAYDSPILRDGDLYEFSLCEKCLKEIIDSFQHPAYIGNHILEDI